MVAATKDVRRRKNEGVPASTWQEGFDYLADGDDTYPGSSSLAGLKRRIRPGTSSLHAGYVRWLQRKRLIDGFTLVAAEDGYEEASLRAICRRAGVGTNAFYEFFDTKEELFAAAYDEGIEMLVAQVNEVTADIGKATWPERVQAAFTELLVIFEDNPAFARLAEIEVHKAGPEMGSRVDASYISSLDIFVNTVAGEQLPLGNGELLPLVLGGIHARLAAYIRAEPAWERAVVAISLTEFVVALLVERKQPSKQPRRTSSVPAGGFVVSGI